MMLLHTEISLSKRLRGLWWNQSFWRWILISLMLYKASIGFVSAEPDLTPVFTYEYEGSCEWLPDNTLLIISKRDYFELGMPIRFLYDPQRQLLTALGGLSHRFSLISTLSSILPRLSPLPEHPPSRAELHTSPDGRFVVYQTDLTTSLTETTSPSIALVDLNTHNGIVIPDLSVRPFGAPPLWKLKWGNGSNALTVLQENGMGETNVWYAHGFESSLDEIEVILIAGYHRPDTIPKWYVHDIFDIDSTGRFILAQINLSRHLEPLGDFYLIIIDTHDFTYKEISKARFFSAARFEQPDDENVFYFSTSGIFAYDRVTETNEMLQEDNVDYRGYDYFTCQPTISPDGRFMAFDDNDDVNEVIVLPIKQP